MHSGGTVHAVSQGSLVEDVCESSDVTPKWYLSQVAVQSQKPNNNRKTTTDNNKSRIDQMSVRWGEGSWADFPTM